MPALQAPIAELVKAATSAIELLPEEDESSEELEEDQNLATSPRPKLRPAFKAASKKAAPTNLIVQLALDVHYLPRRRDDRSLAIGLGQARTKLGLC